MRYGLLVEQYLLGPEILRQSISGMSDDQLNASPIPFKWSTREVVLHLAVNVAAESESEVHLQAVSVLRSLRKKESVGVG